MSRREIARAKRLGHAKTPGPLHKALQLPQAEALLKETRSSHERFLQDQALSGEEILGETTWIKGDWSNAIVQPPWEVDWKK